MSNRSCPSQDELLQLTSGDLSPWRFRDAQQHVRHCDSCRQTVHDINRVFHAHRTYADDPDDQPRWSTFGAALQAQHDALWPPSQWAVSRPWWSVAAAVALLVVATGLWYRYTEVPLSAETLLMRAIAHEESRPRGSRGVTIRPIAAAATAADPYTSHLMGAGAGRRSLESDRARLARELARRLGPFGFDADVPLSARYFQRWRATLPTKEDRLVWLAADLIKVLTISSDGPIPQAEIVVRSTTFEPVAQTWRFLDGFSAELTTLADATDPLASPSSPVAASPTVPPASAPRHAGDLDLVELELRAALHRLGVPVSPRLSLRQVGAHVLVEGSVPTARLAEAVTMYARDHGDVEAHVRPATGTESVREAALAPGIDAWLEVTFGDHEQRRTFGARAADLAMRLRANVGELAALAERYPARNVPSLSTAARTTLQALAAAKYRDATAAYEVLEQHLAALVGVSRPIVPDHLPTDWHQRTASLSVSCERLTTGLNELLARVDLQTVPDVRQAAQDALGPRLAAVASALGDPGLD